MALVGECSSLLILCQETLIVSRHLGVTHFTDRQGAATRRHQKLTWLASQTGQTGSPLPLAGTAAVEAANPPPHIQHRPVVSKLPQGGTGGPYLTSEAAGRSTINLESRSFAGRFLS